MITLPELNFEEVEKQIGLFLKNVLENSGSKGYVIGLSGGIDSTVALYLAKRNLGNEKLLALIMPEKDVTPEEDINDAINVCEELKIDYKIIEISKIKNEFIKSIDLIADKKTIGNLSPRIRMTILYYFANYFNYLVLGTGDKSELLIGYFTKYGDGGVDVLPLGDLYKTYVRKLGKYLGIPEKIVNKKSSPRLWKGHLAEEEIGISYEILDKILYGLVELEYSIEKISEELNIEKDIIKKIKQRIIENEHKRRGPIICDLGLKGIGIGYRLPATY